MTDSEGIGEDMQSSPVTHRECDVRFEVVKEIRTDVREITGKIDDIKALVGALSTDMSTVKTVQSTHLNAHDKGSHKTAVWVAIVIAFLTAASAVVFGVLSNT